MRIKTKSILKIFFICFLILLGSSSVKAVYLGDVTGDGKVTSEDSRIIARAVVDLEQLTSRKMIIADINEDGKLDSEDARLASRTQVGLEELKPMLTKDDKLIFTATAYYVYKNKSDALKSINGSVKLKTGDIIIIREVDSDFFNNRLLKINNGEYIKYNAKYYKRATNSEIIRKVIGDNKIYIDSGARAFTMYEQNLYSKVSYTKNGQKPNGTVAKNGCGPTSCCIISSGYGYKDTPSTIVKNYYEEDDSESAQRYFLNKGFTVGSTTYYKRKDESARALIKEKLKNGYKIMASVYSDKEGETVRIGNYTTQQTISHFFTLIDIDAKGSKVFLVDPDSTGNNRYGWFPLSKFDHFYNIIWVKK